MLILASGSPRRREMLENLGVKFVTRPANVDESPLGGELPEPYVLRLARAKAQAAADASPEQQEIVLAADTIVALDGELLGKPRDPADARGMLERLSGREHEVLTGVAVVASRAADSRLPPRRGGAHSGSGSPSCQQRRSNGTWGVASRSTRRAPTPCRGSARSSSPGLSGNYSNVVGLPLPLTYRLLAEVDFTLRT